MQGTQHIQYSGFHPSQWTESYLQMKMTRLQELAPYGAVLIAKFRRQGPIFNGVVQINSAAGTFFAKSSGRKLKEVSGHIADQILHQLGKWKSERIGRDSIRHMYEEETEQSSA